MGSMIISNNSQELHTAVKGKEEQLKVKVVLEAWIKVHCKWDKEKS